MSEYANEPIRGLPGRLPPGETLLWQGSPDWRRLAVSAFHVRLVAAYFGALLVWAVIDAATGGGTAPVGIGMTAMLGIAAVSMLSGLAFWSAKTTVYSITSRRVVLRFGMALPKCVNLPFAQITTARLGAAADGSGDIALALTEKGLPYPALWPHARAWALARPEPSLRALPDAARVAAVLADACTAAVPAARRVAADATPGMTVLGGAVAA